MPAGALRCSGNCLVPPLEARVDPARSCKRLRGASDEHRRASSIGGGRWRCPAAGHCSPADRGQPPSMPATKRVRRETTSASRPAAAAAPDPPRARGEGSADVGRPAALPDRRRWQPRRSRPAAPDPGGHRRRAACPPGYGISEPAFDCRRHRSPAGRARALRRCREMGGVGRPSTRSAPPIATRRLRSPGANGGYSRKVVPMLAVIGGALDFGGGKARASRQTSSSSPIPARIGAGDLDVLSERRDIGGFFGSAGRRHVEPRAAPPPDSIFRFARRCQPEAGASRSRPSSAARSTLAAVRLERAGRRLPRPRSPLASALGT